MSSESDLFEQFYAAINRFDIDAAATFLAPDAVRVEPEGFPTAGTYRGIDAIKQHLVKGRGSWAEGACNPEGVFVNGDKVVVYLHAWVRVHNATEWSGGRFADGFVVRDGLICEYYSFGEREDACEWAGISPS
jgi:ketosteroid isomerase-like protein